jgi:hypothetical protein
MKISSRILTFAFIVAIGLVVGCSTSHKLMKPSMDQPTGSKPPVATARASQNNPSLPKKPVQAQTSTPELRYEPPTSSNKLAESDIDPREKAEVTKAALEFTRKNVPQAKHVKVCFSVLYGGWYMLVFDQKGKTFSKEHLSWNSETKEWEPVEQEKQLAPHQMEFELKGDVPGEKCFLLK